MLITIVDCDQETFTEEHEITARDGLELRRSQARTEQEVIAAAEGAEGILVQYAPITAQVMDALPDLRAIGRYGVGVDTVDVEAATARGIAVCNVVDYGTEDVSDHAIALALTCARGTARFDRRIRTGEHDLAPVKPLHRLSTRTVGILGLGRIGRATGAKARALGCRVLGSDPTIEPGTTTEEGIETVDQDTLLA
ncbi:MAG: NAD(P)-dependent oxidoreductase, partial [Brachybacterium sp.]|nr:NAD(P)-dependent oxidoreductase [Brachybacterium sp.]